MTYEIFDFTSIAAYVNRRPQSDALDAAMDAVSTAWDTPILLKEARDKLKRVADAYRDKGVEVKMVGISEMLPGVTEAPANVLWITPWYEG